MRRVYLWFSISLVVLVVVAGIGCRSTAQTSSAGPTGSAETKTFSKYGLSFDYPVKFSVWQEGLLESDPSEDSGAVQAAPEEGTPLFAVSWTRTWQWGLEGGLEAGFAGIQDWEGIRSIEKGPVVETTKMGHRVLHQVGHRMLYQYYTATTETDGEKAYGIVASFYCDKTQRVFAMVTMQRSSGTPTVQQAMDYLGDYLDSFICH